MLTIDQTSYWRRYIPLHPPYPRLSSSNSLTNLVPLHFLNFVKTILIFIDVTTRGKYYPDTALATERDPPLYLHITATTYPALEKASRMVQELIDRDLGSLVDERRFRRTDERDEFGRRKWPEEKIPIGMESVRGFNVRAQIVGPSVHTSLSRDPFPCPRSLAIFYPPSFVHPISTPLAFLFC